MGLHSKHVWLVRTKMLCVGAYMAEHALLTFASLHTYLIKRVNDMPFTSQIRPSDF
jgi:hypothetical protein